MFGKECFSLSSKHLTLFLNLAVPLETSYTTGMVGTQPVEFAQVGPHKLVSVCYFKHMDLYFQANPLKHNQVVLLEFFTPDNDTNNVQVDFHTISVYFTHLRELKRKHPGIYIVLTPVMQMSPNMTKKQYNSRISKLVELEKMVCLMGRKDCQLVFPSMTLMHAIPTSSTSNAFKRDYRQELEPLFNSNSSPTREYIYRLTSIMMMIQESTEYVQLLINSWLDKGWNFPHNLVFI